MVDDDSVGAGIRITPDLLDPVGANEDTIIWRTYNNTPIGVDTYTSLGNIPVGDD